MSAGPWTLRETDRATTGQQRVDRVAFAAGGQPARRDLSALRPRRRLPGRARAASWLRSGRSSSRDAPSPWPRSAIDSSCSRRPTGDQRHVEPGWWETFDLDGNRIGGRNLAGYYPDDLAVSPDGKYLLLLSSGRAEGDPKKPLPALEIIAVDLERRLEPRRGPR